MDEKLEIYVPQDETKKRNFKAVRCSETWIFFSLRNVLFLISFSFFLVHYSQKNNEIPKDDYLVIIFGDHFKSDTIDFFVNNNIILNDVILKSSQSYGSAFNIIKIAKNKNYLYITASNKKVTKIKSKKNELKILINFRNSDYHFKINPNSGKYLMFLNEEREGGKIVMKQSHEKFAFD